MNDGSWTVVVGEHGESVAVVCTVDPQGREKLLSDCGRRFERAGTDGFVDADTGTRYWRRPSGPRQASGAASAYRVEATLRGDLLDVHITGDHCRSSAIEAEWQRAVAIASTGSARLILVVRGPGRIASDLEKVEMLQRFLRIASDGQRVAVVVPGCELVRCALLPALAAARGVTLSVFDRESAAAAWLRGCDPVASRASADLPARRAR